MESHPDPAGRSRRPMARAPDAAGLSPGIHARAVPPALMPGITSVAAPNALPLRAAFDAVWYTRQRAREKETAYLGPATWGEGLPCITCSSVGERGPWAQKAGATIPGGAGRGLAAGVQPMTGVGSARARATRAAGIAHAAAGMMHAGRARVTAAAPRVGGPAPGGGQPPGARPHGGIPMTGAAVPQAQELRGAAARARPAMTTTTTARTGAAWTVPPTARYARGLLPAPTPGMRRGARAVLPDRADSGVTRTGRGAHAQG
jgi:hypothetical protein